MSILKQILIVTSGVFVAGTVMNALRNQKIVGNAISGFDK